MPFGVAVAQLTGLGVEHEVVEADLYRASARSYYWSRETSRDGFGRAWGLRVAQHDHRIDATG